MEIVAILFFCCVVLPVGITAVAMAFVWHVYRQKMREKEMHDKLVADMEAVIDVQDKIIKL